MLQQWRAGNYWRCIRGSTEPGWAGWLLNNKSLCLWFPGVSIPFVYRPCEPASLCATRCGLPSCAAVCLLAQGPVRIIMIARAAVCMLFEIILS